MEARQPDSTPPTVQKAARPSSDKLSDVLSKRSSQELIIAFMGAVGCGLARAITECETQLKATGYQVERIKLSRFIEAQIMSKTVGISESDHEPRYLRNQSGGNELRRTYGTEVLAEYGIEQITRHRLANDPDSKELHKPTSRVAYLIDQIKHPDEIHLLRMVYRSLFYLVGVMSTQNHRKQRLQDEGLRTDQTEIIIERDRKEIDRFGQQLEQAFKLADYFVHNPRGDDNILTGQLQRFLALIHGQHGNTPTRHEYAMYVAYASAMQSSCLSRQVGAVITDRTGHVIATGTNDVPKYGGGLYETDHTNDDRCFKNRQKCDNTAQKALRKSRIKESIKEALPQIFSMTPRAIEGGYDEQINKLANAIYRESGIPDLIEFSRAVHAEMDALISLTRGGSGSTVGGNLYTTTFPCHNCARHIVAAGIDNVYYIEPYEKSLASIAHSDSIELLDHDHETSRANEVQEKVRFIHFSGVGPRLYPYLFQNAGGRKDENGTMITPSQATSTKVIQEYLDSYRAFELKVARNFSGKFPIHQASVDP